MGNVIVTVERTPKNGKATIGMRAVIGSGNTSVILKRYFI
jgi:hypothetical protein